MLIVTPASLGLPYTVQQCLSIERQYYCMLSSNAVMLHGRKLLIGDKTIKWAIRTFQIYLHSMMHQIVNNSCIFLYLWMCRPLLSSCTKRPERLFALTRVNMMSIYVPVSTFGILEQAHTTYLFFRKNDIMTLQDESLLYKSPSCRHDKQIRIDPPKFKL